MRKGFTLIELLIVLAIVGILVAIAIVGLEGAQMSARNVTRENAISAISKDLISYFNSNHYYPTDILFSHSGGTYSGCYPDNRICFGINTESGQIEWTIEGTTLNGILSNNSGLNGSPSSNNKTTSSQTQFFYFDSVLDHTHYPLGYLLGFCKEGGGISYITGGTKSPKVSSQTNNQLTVQSPSSSYSLVGPSSGSSSQPSVTCN
ncbi:type II secretion system GspH family protein [Patescibacteria group bacterium]|nr:type II secretion system GspH family protein [Patescibacteria group bacterium]